MLRLHLGEVMQQLAALVTGWVTARETTVVVLRGLVALSGRTLPGAGSHVRATATSLGLLNRCVKDVSKLSYFCQFVENVYYTYVLYMCDVYICCTYICYTCLT